MVMLTHLWSYFAVLILFDRGFPVGINVDRVIVTEVEVAMCSEEATARREHTFLPTASISSTKHHSSSRLLYCHSLKIPTPRSFHLTHAASCSVSSLVSPSVSHSHRQAARPHDEDHTRRSFPLRRHRFCWHEDQFGS
jgi:hypothetical protein